jgi:hypothetical protein
LPSTKPHQNTKCLPSSHSDIHIMHTRNYETALHISSIFKKEEFTFTIHSLPHWCNLKGNSSAQAHYHKDVQKSQGQTSTSPDINNRGMYLDTVHWLPWQDNPQPHYMGETETFHSYKPLFQSQKYHCSIHMISFYFITDYDLHLY